jgi:N-terminal domain of toast_rack, DUF2154
MGAYLVPDDPMNVNSILLAAVFACLSGCVVETASGPVRHETRTLERDTAESARVELRMGAGELRAEGGATALMQADFNYNVPGWKPEIRYHSFAGRADLSISQPAGAGHIGNTKYDWNLRLNGDIPTDFLLHFGAGEAHLNLGSLNLRSVEVEMGVGEIHLDLRGMPKHDYNVRIRGGVGEATINLPASAGLYAKAVGGLGEIQVRGLRHENGRWLNEWYDSDRPQIRVDVSGGIGQINLIAE